MAVSVGTITAVHGITHPEGPVTNGSGVDIVCLFIAATFAGTYDQSADASIVGVPTTIAAFMHDGRTYTMLSAAFAAPGLEVSTPIGAKTVAVSTADLTMELTTSNMSTEHGAALLGTFNRPIGFFVCCSAS